VNDRKTIFFVGCVFLMNINVLKSMEIQEAIPQYIPKNKIFLIDIRDGYEKQKYFQLCKDGTELAVGKELFSQLSLAFYAAKVLIDKKKKDNKNIFIRPLSELTPDLVYFTGKLSLKEQHLLPIKLTNNQIEKIKLQTKEVTLVHDKDRTSIKDVSGIDIVVLDDLNNVYRLIGVFKMKAEDIQK